MQKRALAVSDLSCVGRCSLTVSLPILSAGAINTAVLPTAVLSTQTDGFTSYTLRDLTDDITPISEHLKTLSLPFSAIYAGYLASPKQAKIVQNTINLLKTPETFVLIDPVLADNGELYSGLTNESIEEMKKLCKEADLITPNCTEAAFLLDEEYSGNLFTEDELREKLVKLSKLGAKNIVLTGICTIDGKIGAASYSKETDEMSIYEEDMAEGFFPGCGDTFASALLTAILNGYSLFDASKFAVSFVKKCIELTVKNGEEHKYGLCFEYALSDICKLTEKK